VLGAEVFEETATLAKPPLGSSSALRATARCRRAS
jgi:hypothetical protein